MSTSLSYVNTGRTQQKARTRQALVTEGQAIVDRIDTNVWLS
jgi:hypothetical protein